MNDTPSTVGLLGVPHIEDHRRALAEPRVIAALHQSFRDVGMRVTFNSLPADGERVGATVDALRGPHLDVDGNPYYLSAERVRSIVYHKGVDGGCEMDLDGDRVAE